MEYTQEYYKVEGVTFVAQVMRVVFEPKGLKG